jgi:hypothetical protein
MNNQFTPQPDGILIAAVFLLTLATPTFSQQPPKQPQDRTNAERVRQQDMSRREWQLRNFGTQPPNASDRKQLEALMAQTEQDFNRILTLHNQIARAASSAEALDYSFISEAMAEIRKRASRLQNTLALHEPETAPKDSEKSAAFDGAPLKDALLVLCKQIKSFVTNPVIATPGTVHAEQLEKARRDLAGIVRLSAHLKKDADKLSRTAK